MIPWLAALQSRLGLRETPGPSTTPWIADSYELVGLRGRDDSRVPWCSVALAGAMHDAGVSLDCPITATTPRGRVTAAARSWAEWGEPCDLRIGAVVVLSRGKNPALGHVGLALAWSTDRVKLIGGNQSNMISERWFAASRIVPGGVRWPS